MPKIPAKVERVELDATTLAMLLDGIDVKYVRRPMAWSPPDTERAGSLTSAAPRAEKFDRIDRLHKPIDAAEGVVSDEDTSVRGFSRSSELDCFALRHGLSHPRGTPAGRLLRRLPRPARG
jgi:hypothetical protein